VACASISGLRSLSLKVLGLGCSMQLGKTILHLCADIGSDSRPYKDAGYNVVCVGKDIGVQNYHPPKDVYGIIANPVCTEFSIAKGFHK
jgi:hypothetical protein